MIMKMVRPGLNVRIVTEIDPMNETIRVRASNIYEINGDALILAQTEPPLAGFPHEVVVTYLTGNGEAKRRGFSALVTEVINYRLAGGLEVEALAATKTGEPCPFSLRMFHRVRPTDESRLRVYVGGVRVDVLDISLRGVRFKYHKDLTLQTGHMLQISLDIGPVTYDLQGSIARTWESDEFVSWTQFGFASAEFVTIDSAVERALLRKLHQIERQSRAREEGEEV
jgi:hypothetical protein